MGVGCTQVKTVDRSVLLGVKFGKSPAYFKSRVILQPTRGLFFSDRLDAIESNPKLQLGNELTMQMPSLMSLRQDSGWWGQIFYGAFVLSLHLGFAVFGWSLGATEAIRDDFSSSHADAMSRVSAQLGAKPYREESWPSLEADLGVIEARSDQFEVQLIRLAAALQGDKPEWSQAQTLCAELEVNDCSLKALMRVRQELQ